MFGKLYTFSNSQNDCTRRTVYVGIYGIKAGFEVLYRCDKILCIPLCLGAGILRKI